jgi:uncharacterized membrane protein
MDSEPVLAEAIPILFEAVIVPHRSLSPRGLRLLLGAIAVMCSLNAAVFIRLGAWPVGGFAAIEVLLAAFLLRLNVQAARACESLQLTADALRVVRTDPQGRRAERVLPPAWLTIQLEERPGRVPGLWLGARGVREEVARSLGEDEKRDLARALSEALYRWRNPRFDNPQLAD